MACGEPFRSRTVFGASNGDSAAPIDPKYFVHNPGANPRIEFWLDRPLVWPKKARHLKVSGWCFAISGDEITEVRARVRKKFFRRVSARPGLTSVSATTTDQARCGAVFHSTPSFRPGAANS